MAIEYSNFNLTAGNAVRYWQLSDITSLRYDTADTPMAGEMDPFFFLSKHKNFIPHTYPCRDDFRQHFAEKKTAAFRQRKLLSLVVPFCFRQGRSLRLLVSPNSRRRLGQNAARLPTGGRVSFSPRHLRRRAAEA